MNAPLEPGVRLSGHLLSAEIGSGGFSRVFRAEPTDGGPAVAIKVAVRPELVRALRAEGSILRRLRGPRFVQVLDEHLDADPPYLVLELCEGGDLRARLEREPGKRLAPEAALGLARSILEGVAFAHEEGLTHGDLKPENILLDGEGAPKIADLGLSRAGRRELVARRNELRASLDTAAGKLRGTLDYLAPEVRAGGEITPASDVYALGVLFYELLVGTRPLGLFALPAEVLRGEGVLVPAALDRVVGRALAQDAANRYEDAGAMLRDLEGGDSVVSLETETKERPPEPGANRLLLGVAREAFLDRTVVIVWVAFFWSVVPTVLFLALGEGLVALVLDAIVGVVLVSAYLLLRSEHAKATRAAGPPEAR